MPQDVAGNPFGQILDERFEVRHWVNYDGPFRKGLVY